MSGAFGPDRRLLAAPDPAAALRPRDPGLRRRSARARTVAFGERRGLPEPRCRFRGPAAEPAARHPRPRERPADPGPPGGSLRQTAVRPARAADGRAGARGLHADDRAVQYAYDRARVDHPDDKDWAGFLASIGSAPQAYKAEIRTQATIHL